MARILPIDKQAVLSQHFLLRSLSPEELGQLAQLAVPMRYEPDQTIFQRGDAGDSLMAVVRGRVKICSQSVEGKELILNIIKPGELFGEIALLDGEPRTADAVALERCELLVLSRVSFLPFVERNPGVALRMMAVLCRRLRKTSAQFEDCLFLEVPARLARALLNLAEAFGQPAKQGVHIDLKLSQQQLGSIVGVTRESVNKHLGEWQRQGWVELRAGYLTIRDRAALVALADRLPDEPQPARRPAPLMAARRI